jgi:hypothetical protein
MRLAGALLVIGVAACGDRTGLDVPTVERASASLRVSGETASATRSTATEVFTASESGSTRRGVHTITATTTFTSTFTISRSSDVPDAAVDAAIATDGAVCQAGEIVCIVPCVSPDETYCYASDDGLCPPPVLCLPR